MSKGPQNREPILALHLDAGKDRAGNQRELLVLLDGNAEVVDVVEGNARSKLRLVDVPTLNPTLDVKPGVYREMLRRKRQGNPTVQQRKNGRWSQRKNRLLSATIGEHAGSLGHLLLRGGRKR